MRPPPVTLRIDEHDRPADRLAPGVCRGVQDVTRFTNMVDPGSKYFPPSGPENNQNTVLPRPRHRHHLRERVCRCGYLPACPLPFAASPCSCGPHGSCKQAAGTCDFRDMTALPHVALLRGRQMTSVFRSPAGLTAMRLTRPCFGDEPYEVEGPLSAAT